MDPIELVDLPYTEDVKIEYANRGETKLTRARHAALLAGADFANRVDAAVLAFETGTHQHLADEAGAEHDQPREQQQAPKNHQRAVLGDNILAENLVHAEIKHDGAAEHGSGEPQRAEEMHWPGQVLEQKPDGDDIE